LQTRRNNNGWSPTAGFAQSTPSLQRARLAPLEDSVDRPVEGVAARLRRPSRARWVRSAAGMSGSVRREPVGFGPLLALDLDRGARWVRSVAGVLGSVRGGHVEFGGPRARWVRTVARVGFGPWRALGSVGRRRVGFVRSPACWVRSVAGMLGSDPCSRRIWTVARVGFVRSPACWVRSVASPLGSVLREPVGFGPLRALGLDRRRRVGFVRSPACWVRSAASPSGSVRGERDGLGPSQTRFGVALFWMWPRRGRNKSAQGNALDALNPTITSEPCKGETSRAHETDEVLEEESRHRRVLRLCRPFRACNSYNFRLVPRALPWAGVWSPFPGGKLLNIKTGALGSVCRKLQCHFVRSIAPTTGTIVAVGFSASPASQRHSLVRQ